MALRFICRSFGPFFLGSEWKVPAEISGVMDDVCCLFFQDGVWRDDTGKKIRSLEKKNHVPWKKYLQPLEKKFRLLWPCGPLVLWSSGPGPLVLWSSGPMVLVLWSCGPLAKA